MNATLTARSQGKCELCGEASNDLVVFEVAGGDGSDDAQVVICASYQQQLLDESKINANDWRCLNEAIWSTVPAVQVLAYRMAHTLAEGGETWAQDLLDTAYLAEEVRAWAEAGLTHASDDEDPKPRDSNGMELSEGDSVTLIKDLDVKGMNFTAKRGTLVKNIHLTSNSKHIEGRINGTTIVIVSAYTKKA